MEQGNQAEAESSRDEGGGARAGLPVHDGVDVGHRAVAVIRGTPDGRRGASGGPVQAGEEGIGDAADSRLVEMEKPDLKTGLYLVPRSTVEWVGLTGLAVRSRSTRQMMLLTACVQMLRNSAYGVSMKGLSPGYNIVQ